MIREDVVIVGGGIAGLATSIALNKIGVKSLVLEGASKLRYEGAHISLFHNAWRALDALGVSQKLEPLYQPFETIRVVNLATGVGQEIRLDNSLGNGPRTLHRKALIYALAEELPPNTIRFSSKLVSIKNKTLNDSSNVTHIELEDGTVIEAKVLIGCDGVHSVVAKWLGLSAPIRSGRGAFRAISVFPDGHGFKHEVTQLFKSGARAGYVPLSETDVVWFITHNVTEKEKELRREDPKEVLIEASKNLLKDFPAEFSLLVEKTDLSTLSWAPLLFRRPWDMIVGPTHKGTVTVAGDAFHPMTPDLGQGGGSALEDAVVLARSISGVLNDGKVLTRKNAERAIEEYVNERKWRVAGLIVGAYLSGWVQQGGGTGVVSGWIVKWFRDHVFFKFIQPRLVEMIRYDCGSLD